MFSLRKVFARWYSTVFGLRNTAAATSLFDFPSATSVAIARSCGVRSSGTMVSDETYAPVARSSVANRDPQPAARIEMGVDGGFVTDQRFE